MVKQLLGVILALIAVAYGGYQFGIRTERQVTAKVSAQLMQAAADRIKAENDLLKLQEALNAQAVADPDAGNVAHSVGSVSRLNQIR